MAKKETVKKKDGCIKAAGQTFTKEQLKASKKFAKRKDLIEILMEDNKQYSIPEVEERIKTFMEGKVG